jgi:polyvinyl alcohol dehydrogenase (cytochrome)
MRSPGPTPGHEVSITDAPAWQARFAAACSLAVAPLRGVRMPARVPRLSLILASLSMAALASSPTAAAAHDDATGDWPMFGRNLANTADALHGGVGDVSKLTLKWTFDTGGDVSARAAVVGGRAYFPDWGGNLWAIDTKTGRKIWGHQLSDYGLPADTHSRTTPAVEDGTIYVGTQEGAWLLAIDARNGLLRWKTQLETAAADPYAVVTASPVVSGDMLYTGVASLQENAAAVVPGFVCCNARGSVVAVNLRGRHRGEIAWQTRTVPDGYSGGAVWGSGFVVDRRRNTVFVGTGNNYSHPTDPQYLSCLAAGGSAQACQSPDNHVDSILALDGRTGAIKWSHKFVDWAQPGILDGSDDWNVACFFPDAPNCPSIPGPDYDFSSAPNLVTFQDHLGHERTVLGAGQKSGIYFALDPDSGTLLWQTQVGPGSTLGGMEWGSATDGKRIYVAVANFFGLPTAVGNGGSWAALDPETGAVLWQVGDPSASIALGPLTVSDGVVYAPSMAGDAAAPTMLALDASNGQTLWSFAAGSSVNAGATVVHGDVFWGSGYAHLGIPGFTGNSKFFAFSGGKVSDR